MNRLPQRFIEDRALRDAARAVLVDDVERLRESLSEQSITSRVSSGVTSTVSQRIRTGADDLIKQVGDQKGWVALLVGVIVLWFTRGPILDWLDEIVGSDDEDLARDDDGNTLASPATEGDPE
ncbi:hypothetical protein [Porphyrobacter sp. AAP60]|uniref:hypothetical protein n=1 Tax=Porphyrobacter sp. AAP60 TaxID=1523423 RepID=UPI0006B95F0C|nr:hypothetical protein [Porphyrobacter sp. AAP60]KPF65132.1 hypothetical protein IP79_02810 [Porphyrobacter sp. AAP60]